MTERIDPSFNMQPPREDWLNRHREDVIDPELPIIDAHHHLWALPDNRYLVPDFLKDAGTGHNIRATVHVQCFQHYRTTGPEELRSVGETEFLAGIADESDKRGDAPKLAAAIVGYADLSADNIQTVMMAHIAAARGRFRGIRTRTARDPAIVSPMYEPPPADVLVNERFWRGAACLAELDCSLDCYVFHHQLPELARLAGAFPQLSIMLNHAGMPLGAGPYASRRGEIFQEWRANLAVLSRHQNVFIKMGGLGMPLFGFGLHERALPPSSQELAELWRPYVETCIERFGTTRAVFESNFPMDKASCSYVCLWNAFKRLTRSASEDDKRRLFHDNAGRFYRL